MKIKPDSIYPLSPTQEGFLFYNEYHSESPAYFNQIILELEGEVDVESLKVACQLITDHHPALRTGFLYENLKRPLQYVIEAIPIIFSECDRKHLPEHDREQDLSVFLKEDFEKKFDFTKVPLFRIALIHYSLNSHYFIWTQAHILTDGWSTDIILGDLLKAYVAIKKGAKPYLPVVPPYQNYIVWLQKQDMKKAEYFWKNELLSIEEPSYLCSRANLKKDQEKQYASCNFIFSVEKYNKFDKFIQKHHLTLNTFLQGGIALTLRTYMQQLEIVVGITVSGRSIPLPGIEKMVGNFINTLPLKIAPNADETIIGFLLKLQKQIQLINDYAYVSLAQIQAWSSIQQSIFDVIIVSENYSLEKFSLNEENFKIKSDQRVGMTEYPLTIVILPGENIEFSFVYQTEYFNEEFIKGVITHIENVLDFIIQFEEEKTPTVNDIMLLTLEEEQKIFNKWNEPYIASYTHNTIHQLFEMQVKKNPNKIAVVSENQEITYQELNEKSNQLAHYLISLGVTPDTLIAVCVERSPITIRALLAVLKAGGAYMALEIDSPKNRMRRILENTAPPVLLIESCTQEKYQEILSYYRGEILVIDKITTKLEEYSKHNPTTSVFPNNLAYVIYTSGSTGEPKGVMVQHHNVVRLFKETDSLYHFNADDVWTLFHSLTFDFSVWELWGALFYGGKLIIVPYLVSRNPKLFHILLKQQRVTVLNQTPSAFYELMAYEESLSSIADKLSLRFVILGGEALEYLKLKSWFSLYSTENTKLINMYGITETTVHVTYFPVSPETLQRNAKSIIGKKISDLKIFILDRYLNPVPIGVKGELYISGMGLGRGYLNDPKITAERFIPNPFIASADVPNASNLRLYRTGDLARYLEDGTLEYLGRIDNQVKIRGFRIELGEVESALHSLQNVAQAVVLVHEHNSDDKILVAYVVLQKNTSSDSDSLKEQLASILPGYMIPTFFVFLDNVPLTSNGKIDRKSLRLSQLHPRQTTEQYVSPTTPIEKKLCAIWQEILEIEPIGIHDNFFKLGGHSLIATRLIARVRNIYNVDIPLRILFEKSTILAFSSHLDSLLKEKAVSLVPTLGPMKRIGKIPLSFAQMRLWFLDQLIPHAALYNIPIALRIRGPLNKEALQESLNIVILRHESLRTIFPALDGEAHQVVLGEFAILLNEEKIVVQENQRPDIIKKAIEEEARTSFNLATGPLIRVRLLLFSEGDYVLLITLHHIISDGWSMKVFFQELSIAYNAYVLEREPELPILSIQYADFTFWQRQWLQGEILQKQLRYWKTALNGIPDLLEFPVDKQRPKEASYRAFEYQGSFSKEITLKLHDIAQQHQVSLFMMLLTAFQVLLYRYTGQQDIVVGIPVSNRQYKETEALIGFFVNTLAIRTTFAAHKTFLEILHSVRETVLQAYQNQDIPFEQLVDHLNVSRELNRNPIFQTMFTFEPVEQRENLLNLNNLSITPIVISGLAAKFDLSLTVTEKEEGIDITIHYAMDIFLEETILRLATHLQSLISGIVEDPDKLIGEYILLNSREKQQFLINWNKTEMEYPEHKTIHELFEWQVDKTPYHVALIHEGEQLTYQKLNEKSNQLAHYMVTLGVGPESIVAIAVPRSLDMIIGLLAILKTGAAYLPLDPDYPIERLLFMLNDGKAEILLTIRKLRSLFEDVEQTIIYLEESNFDLPTTDLLVPVSTFNLAYISYTSGSTGKPKGVMCDHQGVINRLYWAWQTYPFKSKEVCCLQSSIAFVDSTWDIFGTLLKGATLVLYEEDVSRDAELLIEYVEKFCITRITVLPSFLKLLTQLSFSDSKIVNRIGEMQHWEVTGERFDHDSAYEFIHLFKNKITFLDCYGATEATSVIYRDFSNTEKPFTRILGNTKIYILDTFLNPVPIGVKGEIYIEGVGVARGYWNRPELTAEKFVPNPFISGEDSDLISLRLYRTGDLASYSSDGHIEFFGRIDSQVKIRGFRVELAEIESILNSHPEVAQSIVVARNDEKGDKNLIAYLILREEISCLLSVHRTFSSSSGVTFHTLAGPQVLGLIEELRDYLSNAVPNFMIPSFFIFIDKVILTPNGKMDRQALPEPDLSLRQVIEQYITPSNSIESLLCKIWMEVLKIDKIGVSDNFFKVGGHSLLATRVISRIRRQFNVEIPLRAIFDYPTVRKLGEKIASLNRRDNLLSLPRLIGRKRTHPIPLSLAQKRLWFLEQLFPGIPLYNIPLAFILQGSLNIDALQQGFNTLLSRHESLRTIFPVINGEAHQLVIPDSSIDLKESYLVLNSDDQKTQFIEAIATEEANLNFDLSVGPLFRVKLIAISPKKHLLLMTLHHIISDAWSMSIFFRELAELYNAYKRNLTFSLNPLPIQYADFTIWQRKWLKGKTLEKQISYWKKQLSGIPESLELFTDRLRPKVLTYKGAYYNYRLPKSVTDSLSEIAEKKECSLFMVLLTIFKILLYRYTGQKDIVVGSPVANRNHQELEGLVGFFVNILVLRTILKETESFVEVLQKVKAMTLEAYQYQDVYFDQLVEYLNFPRVLNKNPVFQVAFSFEPSATFDDLALDELTVSPVYIENGFSRLDLKVSANECQDGINLNFNYSTELFEKETVQRFASHFAELAAEVIKDSSKAIERLSFIKELERQRLLVEWNTTKIKYPDIQAETVVNLFEVEQQKNPNKAAIRYQNQLITYAELNQRANQLAQYLISSGVRPGTLVALALRRTPEMIIVLLGILKAGATCLALDVDYPRKRLQYILQDTSVSLVLTSTKLISKLPITMAQYICLEDEWRNITKLPTLDINLGSNLEQHLACIIYTSGSTGEPKGVMVTHKNLVEATKARLNYYTSPLKSLLLLSSIAFDSTIAGIFWSLASGMAIVLPEDNETVDTKKIMSEIEKHKISHLICVPSLYKVILAFQRENRSSVALAMVVIGGERHDNAILQQHTAFFPLTALYNEYGVTEAGVWSSVNCLYTPKADFKHFENCIGRPIANTVIYILDKYMEPVPIGVKGEIYIGGFGLARGYLNLPQLTAERFIPNPFSKNTGYLTLYRTGDLARYLSDGNIEFLGRLDNQLKIRGFRIEPEEIESVLNSHHEIKQAVVTVKEDETGDKRLLAYLIPKRSSISFDNLKEHLAHSLPHYMVPSFFALLDKIPYTQNGKIDRKQVFAMQHPVEIINENYIAPTTFLEKELCSIWSEILKVDKIGIHDNFFKLGGHSLSATLIITRVRHLYNINIPLRALFEQPTVFGLKSLIQLLQEEDRRSSFPPLKVIKRNGVPLSFAQARLWFLENLIPNSSLYNMPVSLKITGNLDINALEYAFNTLILRHESLRTIFPTIAGTAQQVVLNDFSLDLSECLVDLSLLPESEKSVVTKELAQREANAPFNLALGPLIRVKLLLLSEKEYALLLTLHHIISDGWSMNIIFRELTHIYDAYISGNNPALALVAIQYKDFTVWQREWLQGAVLQQQLSYWSKQLKGIPDILALPFDKIRPKESTYQGGEYRCFIASDVKQKLNKLAVSQEASLFMVLLTAFQILLYRYSGEVDIIVGTPIANRHHKEVEGLIGLFVNTLIIRTIFHNDMRFLELLGSVKENILEAYQYQDVPFEQVVDHLQVQRALNRNPIFQVMFSFEAADTRVSFSTDNLVVENIVSSYPLAKFDLSLNISEDENGLVIRIDYAKDLFEEGTIQRLGKNFRKLVKEISRNPDQLISEYVFLTGGEQSKMLIQWNNTDSIYPGNQTIDVLFEEKAITSPNNIALIFEGQRLSYQQLNDAANELAYYLRSIGVGPDTLVAIAIPKSFEMIIGLLGILKAGGGYVPLDLDYPEERLLFILQDTKAQIILLRNPVEEKFSRYQGERVSFYFDERTEQLFIEGLNPVIPSTKKRISNTTPDNLAYTIYTSGSTGTPKGVMITHKGVIRLVKNTNYLDFEKNLIFVQSSNVAFDAATFEIWGSLLNGKTLLLMQETLQEVLLQSQSLFKDYLLTVFLTTQLFNTLVDNHLEELLKIDYLLFGGEFSSAGHVRKFLKNNKKTKISHVYGPTESTTFASRLLDINLAIHPVERLPIGSPISNTKMYILDRLLNPVPIGVKGEIYISGAGLARGYRELPELTAEKFLPNPFVNQCVDDNSQLRLYRTGDFACYDANGNIEFLGRVDKQVKIRGFRIELDEIQMILNTHPDVIQGVASVVVNNTEMKRIVAYVVLKQDILSALNTILSFLDSSEHSFSVVQGKTTLELDESFRLFLSSFLPEYMVPSSFVYLDRMPLNMNGKIDYKFLAKLELNFEKRLQQSVAPQSQLEKILCAIWSETLNLKEIGIHDNFFRIGGDSIVSIQLVAKARANGIYFTVKDIFNHSTISTLSAVVKFKEESPTLKPHQAPLAGLILLSPIQRWFFAINHSNPHHFNQATLLLIRQPINLITLEEMFVLLVSYHDALRFRYSRDSYGVWQQECLPVEETTICTEVDFSSFKDSELSEAIERESFSVQQSLNIEKGPLIKVVLFNCGELRPQRLLLIIHHLVVDGVSWRILLKDLESLYLQLLKGVPMSLSPKTHSYQQWSHALLDYFNFESLEEEMLHWQKISNAIQPLPIDFDDGPAIFEYSRTFSLSLSEVETTLLLQDVPKAYHTEINDILLTALVLSIGSWQKSYSLTLSLESHGREDINQNIDLSRTIGWFTAIFPVLLENINPDNLLAAIKAVKETLRQIPRKGIGYGILHYLQGNESPPLYPSLSFNYLGQWDNTFSESGPFNFSGESSGQTISLQNKKTYLIEINTEIRAGVFHFFCSYSTRHYHEKTIIDISSGFMEKLKEIIQHGCKEKKTEYTFSDFNLSNLEDSKLANRIKMIEEEL
jgi:amino acid adenylation domain-containing protein/non-ribosomal peptide synthase protein (TIGR01720 family)